jgi:hypothetical protein
MVSPMSSMKKVSDSMLSNGQKLSYNQKIKEEEYTKMPNNRPNGIT